MKSTGWIACALALIITPVLAQESDQEVSADETLLVELTADAPVLEGHGPSATFKCAIDFEGTLHVWAISEEVDAFLRVEGIDGVTIGEDEDSGEDTTPFLAIPVSGPTPLRITVSSSRPGETGFLELHTASLHETEEARGVATLVGPMLEENDRLYEAGEREAARTLLFETWEALLPALGGDLSTDIAEATWDLGFAAFRLDEFELASNTWRHTMEHRHRVLPDDHKRAIHSRSNVGVTLNELGAFAEAREILERNVASCRRVLSENNKFYHTNRVNLANSLLELGDYPAAREVAEETVRLCERVRGQKSRDTWEAREKLAVIMALQGDHEGAREILQEILEVYERNLSPDDVGLLSIKDGLALAIRELGDLGTAHRMTTEVLASYERTLPEDHPTILRVRGNLATIRGELGDFAGARKLLEGVLAGYSRAIRSEWSFAGFDSRFRGGQNPALAERAPLERRTLMSNHGQSMLSRLFILLLSIFAGACLTTDDGIEVRSEFAPGVITDLGRTFDWFPDGDETKSSQVDPELDAFVRSKIEQELTRRGYHRSSQSPRFQVAYDLGSRNVLDSPFVGAEIHEEGALGIMVIDPERKVGIWRGIGKARIETSATPSQRRDRIHRAIRAIIAKLPRAEKR